MEKCHQTSDTADWIPTNSEWNMEMKPVSMQKKKKQKKKQNSMFQITHATSIRHELGLKMLLQMY